MHSAAIFLLTGSCAAGASDLDEARSKTMIGGGDLGGHYRVALLL